MSSASIKLDLIQIAATLEGLEETIIFKLIDRAQFAANLAVYQKKQSGFSGEDERSLFDIRLVYQEKMDGEFGRFLVPQERPFLMDNPPSRRTVNVSDTGLHIDDFDAVNVTREIRDAYLKLIPEICVEGDDGNNYGSAVETDIYALRALGCRIHFGALYVAESKYQSDPSHYNKLVAKKDLDGLMASLTRAEVEERILERVAAKVDQIQATINPKVRRRIPPEAIMSFYRTTVIPLTKEGEIKYFLNRVV